MEAAHLTRVYREAVGWALQYGIKVYLPGGQMKALGTLQEEIRAHENRLNPPPPRPSALSGLVQARCGSGHPATWMNAPLMVKPHSGMVTFWGASPVHCHCGSQYRAP